MNTIQITDEQAAVIAEALELAATMAHRADDEAAFAYFQMTDLIYEKVPSIVGKEYSEFYARLDARL